MKRVYLSFAEEDLEKVVKLLPLLESAEYELDYCEGIRNIDFDSQAENIKHSIGEKIVKCSVCVCLISDNTHKSKWADCQLQKSQNKGNLIIAMALKGTESAVLPAVVKEKNLKFYPWDPARLKQLITENTSKLFNNSL